MRNRCKETTCRWADTKTCDECSRDKLDRFKLIGGQERSCDNCAFTNNPLRCIPERCEHYKHWRPRPDPVEKPTCICPPNATDEACEVCVPMEEERTCETCECHDCCGRSSS